MGKHGKKDKKSKKHKHKSKKRDSSSSSSISSEEWVEKDVLSTNELKTENIDKKCETEREEWMSLPSTFRTSSLTDRRTERQEAKEKEKQLATYDPRKSVRELNPYWKNDGDGLPSLTQIKSKFKKPNDDVNNHTSYKSKSSLSKWRKNSPERTYKKQYESSTSRSNYSSEKFETKDKIDESSDFLSAKQMNELGAKIIKAEIMGQTTIVNELKEKLERARQYQKDHPNEEESIILYRSDSKGYTKPLNTPETSDNYKRKKNKMETHEAGKRQKYFPDDDKYSLQQMYENEKLNTTREQDSEFLKLTSKSSKMDDMDDIFVDKIRNEKTSEKKMRKEKDIAIQEHQRMMKSLDHCKYCLQSGERQRHLMITLGETIYLRLPDHEPLTDGHCLLVPTRHVSCSTQLDENEWSEVMDFRKALTKMFLSENEDIIFYETVIHSHSYSHMVINCVPVSKEQGDLAPIYFKKAIDECETEWSTNKKLINLSGKGVRRAVPKGLPYFFVSFGMAEGYAHVIEDERYFPQYFAAEIIGGILDLHHSKWRKPRSEKFEEQKRRVLHFSNKWKSFDITVK